jgi:hypothetical protein
MWNLTEAQNTAQNTVNKIIESDPDLSTFEVEEVHLERENELFWTFDADIPKLIKEGWIPSAITVLIDKKDGHVWTEQEQNTFHKNWENTRRRAGFLNRK